MGSLKAIWSQISVFFDSEICR